MLKQTSRFLDIVSRPVIENVVFFSIFVLLMGSETLRNLHGVLQVPYYKVSTMSFVNRMCIVILQAYLLCFVMTLIKKRWVKIVSYIQLFVLFFTTSFLLDKFHTFISPNILRLVTETNNSEASNFFSSFVFTSSSLLLTVGFICIIVAVIVLERYDHLFTSYLNKCGKLKMLFGGLMIILLLNGIYSCRTYVDLLRTSSTDEVSAWYEYNDVQPHDSYSMLLYSLHDLHCASQETNQAIRSTLSAISKQPTTTLPNDSLQIVLVIGESYVLSHCQLYGYELPTTPYMCAERDSGKLQVCQHATTPFNQTSPVMKNVLSTNDLSAGEHWYEGTFIPAIFKKSGYEVCFWDNQKQGYGDNTPFTFALNNFLYADKIASVSYSMTNDKSFDYDGDMIDHFKEHVKLDSNPRFVVFHLNGQHFDASLRYPHTQEFKRFTADSIRFNKPWMGHKQRNAMAEYDNCTLYNDYVLKQVFNLFSNKNAVVFYFSDHGDEIYQVRDYQGRSHEQPDDPNLIEAYYHVPFIVWYSDVFIHNRPDAVKRLQKSLSQPQRSDNVWRLIQPLME